MPGAVARHRHCRAAGPRLALRAQCRGSFDLWHRVERRV